MKIREVEKQAPTPGFPFPSLRCPIHRFILLSPFSCRRRHSLLLTFPLYLSACPFTRVLSIQIYIYIRVYMSAFEPDIPPTFVWIFVAAAAVLFLQSSARFLSLLCRR